MVISHRGAERNYRGARRRTSRNIIINWAKVQFRVHKNKYIAFSSINNTSKILVTFIFSVNLKFGRKLKYIIIEEF